MAAQYVCILCYSEAVNIKSHTERMRAPVQVADELKLVLPCPLHYDCGLLNPPNNIR